MPSTLTPAQKQEQTQIMFVATIAASCMILSTAFPLITYCMLSGTGFALFLSLKQWTDRANLANPPTALVLDQPSQTMASAIIVLLGIFVLQMNPLSQIILCTTFGAGLAAFFVHDCILKPQIEIDKALREACSKGELDAIKALLALHACPFAPDEAGNNAFHLALQGNEAQIEIYNALQGAATQAPLTLQAILASVKQLWHEALFEKWSECLNQVKKCFKENSKENRASFYEASFQVISAYYAPMQAIINTLAKYLIEQISFPSDIHGANKAGKTPLDLLKANPYDLDPQKLASLQKILEDLATLQESVDEQAGDGNTPLRFSPQTQQQHEARPRATMAVKPKLIKK